MSAIAQRRTAAAAAIMMLFAVLQFVLLTVNPTPASAADPQPTYGSAVVDGDISEWNLSADFFANLIKAGGNGGQTEVLGKAYLRYDCDTSNLYVLALSEGDFDGLGDAWVKIYQLGNSEANTTEVAVGDRGFETVVPNLAPGDYTIEIHFNSDGDTASNARGGGALTIECPDGPGVATASVTGECDDKDDFVAVVSNVSNASVSIDLNGDGDTADAGESGLGNGTYLVSASAGTSIAWEAVVVGDNEFAGGETSISGSFDVDDCSETPPPTPPTQPPAPKEVKGALGDLVWFDENQNGQQDDVVKEFPINGATVTLLTPNGTVLAQQVTGLDGLYLFDQLEAGNYRVEVCLEGTDYTVTNMPGVAKGRDSDVFPLANKGGCALTALINLPPGVTDLTWDAGIVLEVKGIQIEPTTTTTIEPVTVGTLPFTGFESEELVWVSVLAVAAGALLLAASWRRGQDIQQVATDDQTWTNA
jgi:hypothetical protein